MDGISKRQIEEHQVLYENYVKKTNEIRRRLRDVDRQNANANYDEFRELKVELSFTLDAVKLHEAYFFNLGGGGRPSDKLMDMINRSFGSFDAWERDLRASGMAARGWAITAYDFDDNRLHNFIADDHNTYGIWNSLPVIVLDVYEHAYMIDYGIKRVPYIDAFFKNINWNEVNNRVEGIVIGSEPRPSM
ncbi:MAG TPA: superoxide dismutase [Armatimonadota bacterium]|nr:superoxide dismutase [Armatimonadota bacterium]HOM72701.1 superoxide dismutase [Armatimonadota bacterium]HOP79107.1 superoxide dismutase [Armatimonadota bacterium]HPP74766.1 superoxide dismutase [Armatimonadota bacterium]